MTAVATDGTALRYAAMELRTDRPLVLAAVNCNSNPETRNPRPGTQNPEPKTRNRNPKPGTQVKSHGAALIHADPALRADKQVFHR
jgi:hypothetical protein